MCEFLCQLLTFNIFFRFLNDCLRKGRGLGVFSPFKHFLLLSFFFHLLSSCSLLKTWPDTHYSMRIFSVQLILRYLNYKLNLNSISIIFINLVK